MKKILVAIDGSEPADNALDFALNLVEKYSASLVLLNVYSRASVLSMISYPTYSTATADSIPATIAAYHKELTNRHGKMLEAALKKATNLKPNVKVSTKLMEGNPAQKIVEMAKEENFDLIVVGHRGLSGIKALFLGSVSNRVVHEAECPVLIIK